LAESFSICCFNEMMRFSLAVDILNSPVIESKSMADGSMSLVLKWTIYATRGSDCNPATGGAGDAGGNTS
jgi:hypothetical protein